MNALKKQVHKKKETTTKIILSVDHPCSSGVRFPNFSGSRPACKYRGNLGTHWI